MNAEKIYQDIDKLTRVLYDESINNMSVLSLDNKDNKDKESDKMTKYILLRDEFIGRYSWAIPTKHVIREMAKFIGRDFTLEVGAGSGLWAFLLSNENVSIVATDIKPPSNTFMTVSKYDAITAIKKLVPDVLLLVWPLYDNPLAYNSVKNFTGNKIIYIGEGYYGCTGDDAFHKLLDTEWKEVKKVSIPNWPGINDFATFYLRLNKV